MNGTECCRQWALDAFYSPVIHSTQCDEMSVNNNRFYSR